MKIVFMGTPKPAADILEHLILSGHHIEAVVTMPDASRGRGLIKSESPVSLAAVKYAVKTFKPEKLKGKAFIDEFKLFDMDVAVVVAYGKLIPREILKLPKHGFVNVHASLLPLYRGASPIQAAILNGESETGVTIMQLDEGLDTGDILDQKTLKIDDEDDSVSLSEKLFKSGKELLVKVLNDIESGKIKKTKQDGSKASYAPLIKKEEGFVDFGKTAQEINCKIRAFIEWPGAYTYYKGKKLKLLKAQVLHGAQKEAEPGTVDEILKDEGFEVCCAKDSLLIKIVQPENSRIMSASEFVRGYRIQAGDKLGR